MTQTLSVSLPYDVVYCSGTVNGIDRTWTNTEDNIWETVVERDENDTYEVEVTLVNSVGTVSTIRFTLYYGVLNLITDRTSQDVERWNELRKKGWEGLSEEERAEWASAMKGAYNHTDLNRVEGAVQYIAERLTANGYIFRPEVKTSWTLRELPTRADFDRYFENVKILRGMLSTYSTTPLAPTTKRKLDYQMANDLEKILVDIDDLITKMEQSWLYSNDIFCGEV